MACVAAFTKDGTTQTAVIVSNQKALCSGSVTIPGYSTGSVKVCAWYPSGSNFSCKWNDWWGFDCNWDVISWSKDCWTTPSITYWPSTTITGGASVNTELTYSSTVAYTVSGSETQTKTTTITIKSVTLSLTVGTSTVIYTIGTNISLTPSADGSFTASVQLYSINGDVSSDYYFTITSVLYMCMAEMDSGKPWLSIKSDITIEYGGLSSTTTLTLPIYATAE
jgi:hypothetical protein